MLLAGIILTSCVWLDDSLSGGPSRAESSRHGQDSLAQAPHGTPPEPAPARPDTSILAVAVRFPEDYDWQRDTAYGTTGFDLLLLKDGEPVLTLAYGPEAPFCADPDRHHLLSGHLYTERMAGNETRIGRDGEELFRFSGREFLVGLMEDGEDLYTLSRPVSGQGFSLRKNGEPVILRTDGTPFGTLSDPSYSPTGALYRTDGPLVFCFRGGYVYDYSYYLVRDGSETRLDSIPSQQSVLDIKYSGDKVFTLYSTFLKNLLYEGSIWPEGSGYAVTGCFSDGTGGVFWGYLDPLSWSTQREICRDRAALYRSPEATWAVSPGTDGILRWFGPDGRGQSEVACHFFSPACAALAGTRFVLALNPTDIRKKPRILDGGDEREIDVYGYVSRVAVEISFPAS